MPAEKPATKSSENRRSNKPIMEKRRRARINSCLNDLKALILEALKKDPARHSKLEKADILEMTVKHLQNLQRQQMALSQATDPNVANKFRAGFNECANEVTRFLSRMDAVDQSVQQRLMGHLANCLTGIAGPGSISQQQPPPPSAYHLGNGILAGTTTSPTTKAPSTPMSILPNTMQPLNVHVPSPGAGNSTSVMAVTSSPHHGRSPVENNKLSPPTTLQNTRVVKGLQFVPTRLPNGDIALFLPASYAIPLNEGAPTQNSSPSTTTSMLSPLTINTCTTSSTVANPLTATTGVGETRKSVITPPLTPISEVGRRKEQIGETSSLSPGLTTTLLSSLTVGNVTTPTSVSFSTTPTKLSSDLTSGLRTADYKSRWSPPTATTVGTPPLRELVNTEAHHADSRVFRRGYYHNHHHQHVTSGNNYMYDNEKSHSELPACKDVKNGPWRPW